MLILLLALLVIGFLAVLVLGVAASGFNLLVALFAPATDTDADAETEQLLRTHGSQSDSSDPTIRMLRERKARRAAFSAKLKAEAAEREAKHTQAR